MIILVLSLNAILAASVLVAVVGMLGYGVLLDIASGRGGNPPPPPYKSATPSAFSRRSASRFNPSARAARAPLARSVT